MDLELDHLDTTVQKAWSLMGKMVLMVMGLPGKMVPMVLVRLDRTVLEGPMVLDHLDKMVLMVLDRLDMTVLEVQTVFDFLGMKVFEVQMVLFPGRMVRMVYLMDSQL